MAHNTNEKIFNYTGTLQQTTIPAGTTSIDVHLWGGAGGGGGGDRGGPGGTGAAGHYVTSTSIAISPAQIGQTITVAVGGGGSGGTGGGNAPGGTNGKSIAGYSGGTGGNSGPSGSSGSGGGGGGATVVSINGQEIAVAGGGGGGAGAGIASNGTAGINSNSPTANSPGTLGENGAGHTGDGGGAGAGGGGTDGGASGNGGSGDNGGTGGYAGSNYAAGGTESNGSGTTPGGTASIYYTVGTAVGGNAGSPGADGRAVVVFNTEVEVKTKVGAYTQTFNRSLNSSSDILDFFNNNTLVTGNTPSTYQHGWWVVSPALSSYQWQGYPFYYNNNIWIDQADVTRYAGTNSSDTVITVGNTTYTRIGSPVGGDFTLVFNDGSTANYNIQVYSYTVSGSAGWRNVDDMYTKVAGRWKKITAAYTKVAGSWQAMFSETVNFTETAAGFGDATGGSSSGTPGSGGGCFLAGTMITMADGTQKPVEQVDIRDKVAVGGFVFATGKFLIDNLYDYKGIKVSGTHMVKEAGKWTRVEDSDHGVALGDDQHIVYVFGSEHRRIIIDGTEFTDYFELSEQEELINHGEGIFSNWRDHDRQIHGKNVKILNA